MYIFIIIIRNKIVKSHIYLREKRNKTQNLQAIKKLNTMHVSSYSFEVDSFRLEQRKYCIIFNTRERNTYNNNNKNNIKKSMECDSLTRFAWPVINAYIPTRRFSHKFC